MSNEAGKPRFTEALRRVFDVAIGKAEDPPPFARSDVMELWFEMLGEVCDVLDAAADLKEPKLAALLDDLGKLIAEKVEEVEDDWIPEDRPPSTVEIFVNDREMEIVRGRWGHAAIVQFATRGNPLPGAVYEVAVSDGAGPGKTDGVLGFDEDVAVQDGTRFTVKRITNLKELLPTVTVGGLRQTVFRT